MSTRTPLIVFSHLRWEFVKQRPQHLLERLSQNYDVVFVEEPIAHTSSEYGSARVFQPHEKVTVIQPKIAASDFEALVSVLYSHASLDTQYKPILWFYSPGFISVSSLLESSLIVYDCMDELSQFKGAPPKLVEDEKQLLLLSDLVFTGGRSLYAAKKKRHNAVYCFPSSVDHKHFSKASKSTEVRPHDLPKNTVPIVGFYGVIDERLDLELLQATAERMQDVAFVMIGPVVKIAEDDLPHLPNIYYLGSKDYAELPDYLQHFSVAFMPFALNKATEFISPTKTLEFMAAHKPIVSTPIKDVREVYSSEVRIAATAEEMETAIRAYLHETKKEQAARIALQTAVLKQTSWDKTAREMRHLIETAIREYAISQLSVAQYYKGTSSYRVSL